MDLQVEDLLSSNAVHAIDFDTPEQIHGLIGQLGANINNQVKQASASLNAPEVEQLNALLHEILTRLSQLIQMNTSVKGGSWSDLQERRREAKQPLDAALLRETIATQDSAFTFSSANAAQRTEKAPLFVEQVDKHVRQVYTSQSREHAMLRRQNLDRTASIQTSGEELALPEDLSVALLRIDATLNTTSALVSGLCQRAGTAVSAAADVVSIQRSVP